MIGDRLVPLLATAALDQTLGESVVLSGGHQSIVVVHTDLLLILIIK